MPAFNTEKLKTGKSLMYILSCASVFIYIISAIAFELTEETARISTLAIYALFAVGVFFVLSKNKIIINEYSGFLIAFCIYVYISCMFSNASSTMGAQIAYWTLTCVIACLLVFLMSIKHPQIINYAMTAYIIGALILAIRLISEYGGIDAMIETASDEGENRIGGLLGNENSIGLFFANGILCSLIFFIKKDKKPLRVLLVLVMIALGIMLLLTGSRKSTVLALVGMLLITFFNYRKASAGKKIAVFLIVIALLVVIYHLVTTLPMFSTISERFEKLFGGFFGEGTSYETDMTREKYITEGLQAFYESPIFGNGTGHSYALFGTYSHNNFVELLMNYGIVGFCLYYIPYAVLIVKLFKLVLKKDVIAMYFLAYTIMQMVLAIGWITYYDRPTQIVTALAFGYLFIKKREESETNEIKKLV